MCTINEKKKKNHQSVKFIWFAFKCNYLRHDIVKCLKYDTNQKLLQYKFNLFQFQVCVQKELHEEERHKMKIKNKQKYIAVELFRHLKLTRLARTIDFVIKRILSGYSRKTNIYNYVFMYSM